MTAVWWGVYDRGRGPGTARHRLHEGGLCKVDPALADAVAISALDEEM